MSPRRRDRLYYTKLERGDSVARARRGGSRERGRARLARSGGCAARHPYERLRSRSGDDVAGAEHTKGDNGRDDAVEADQPERGTPGELVVSAGSERVQRAAG